MEKVAYLLGIITMMIIFMIGFWEEVSLGHIAGDMIKECQQELPRTEQCTIIAVPEKDVGG